MCKGSDYKTTL